MLYFSFYFADILWNRIKVTIIGLCYSSFQMMFCNDRSIGIHRTFLHKVYRFQRDYEKLKDNVEQQEVLIVEIKIHPLIFKISDGVKID